MKLMLLWDLLRGDLRFEKTVDSLRAERNGFQVTAGFLSVARSAPLRANAFGIADSTASDLTISHGEAIFRVTSLRILRTTSGNGQK
jgi:hypothetical protein